MRFLVILVFSFLSLVAYSQNDEIEIIEEQVENNTQLLAKNNSDDNIKLTFELESKGLGLRNKKTFKLDLEPNEAD